MADGSMSVAVFAGLVSAITVVAAMSLLGAVALMFSSARTQRQIEWTDEAEELPVLRRDSLRPWPPAPLQDQPTDPSDRPTTPLEATATGKYARPRAPTPVSVKPTPVPSRPTSAVRNPAAAKRARAPRQGRDYGGARPQARGFFEEEEEEYGLATLDPALRRAVAPTSGWADDEGSTEIFSAHTIAEAEYAFADFEESPTRLSGPPGSR